MSVIHQNFFPDPDWVKPLLRNVQTKFNEMINKVIFVSIFTFELEWYPRPKSEILMENAKFPCFLSSPVWQSRKLVFQWDTDDPVAGMKFNEKLFRRHILKKCIELYHTTGYQIDCRISVFGPGKVNESVVLPVKERSKSIRMGCGPMRKEEE